MVNEQDQLSAQVSVLGSLLISPELVGPVLEQVRPEDFTNPQCRLVFQAIRALFTEGRRVDPTTVWDKLGGRPDEGWTQYLRELMDLTPTAANIWEYVPILREQSKQARAVELAGRILADPNRWDEFRVQLDNLAVDRRGVERMDMSAMLLAFMDRHSGEPHQYMTWGLPKLEGGLYADMGDMVVLGGYPSTGKTALAVSFAYHQAKERRVGFYSLETNRYKLADRLISNLVGIDMGTIKKGKISEEEWGRVADQSDHIRARHLDLIEASGMSVQDIQADALANRYDIVYVDYLQIIEPDNRRAVRSEQVAGISRGLQQFAHRTGHLVVALAQLSRAEHTTKNEQVEPTMSDLKESGQIEQDADAIMLLYLEEPGRPDKSRRVLKIAKNKEGIRGRIYLVFDGQYQRFRESALDEPSPAAKRSIAERKKSDQISFEELPDGYEVPF